MPETGESLLPGAPSTDILSLTSFYYLYLIISPVYPLCLTTLSSLAWRSQLLLTRHWLLSHSPAHATPLHLPFSCQEDHPIHKSNLCLKTSHGFPIPERTKARLLHPAFRPLQGLPQILLATLSVSAALFLSLYQHTCKPITLLLASGNLYLFLLPGMPFSLAFLVY